MVTQGSVPRLERASARLALALARSVSRGARVWQQRGLGTIFLNLARIPVLGAAEALVEFEPGCRFVLPVFEPYWGPTVVGGRPFEPEVVALLRAVGDLAPILVDCGANFGYYSVLATGPGFGFGGAVAIEANPSTFERLRTNARANAERFVCLHRAISDTSDTTVRIASAHSHAVAHVAPRGEGGGVEVETITVPDALRAAAFEEAENFVLKLDVEGQEGAALAGSAEWRRRSSHLIVFEDWADVRFETAAALLAEGYDVYYLRADGAARQVTDVDAARALVARDGRVTRSCNFAAVRGGGPFASRLERAARRLG